MKKFTAEFKLECVELITVQGYPVKQAADAMNVGYSSLQKWLRQYREEQRGITPKTTAITSEQKRIQELEKQVKQLESDNNLLKKASAFFAIEMNKGSKSR